MGGLSGTASGTDVLFSYSAPFPWEVLGVAVVLFVPAFLVRRVTWAKWMLITFGVIALVGAALLWANLP